MMGLDSSVSLTSCYSPFSRTLKPSEVLTLLLVSRPIYHLIRGEERALARRITNRRYPSLEKCFRLPSLVREVDPAKRGGPSGQSAQEIVPPHPDPGHGSGLHLHVLPESLELSRVAVDFHYWQTHLEKGIPIRVIPRGTNPEWNRTLVARNASLVTKALSSPLVYAAILELHLDSALRSIRRHGQNKFNHRLRFRLTDEDIRSETDSFLERSGPQTVDIPYHRDNYYMLETFMPNRCWIKELSRWVYMPAEQHEKDVDIAVAFAAWKRRKAEEEARAAERSRGDSREDGIESEQAVPKDDTVVEPTMAAVAL